MVAMALRHGDLSYDLGLKSYDPAPQARGWAGSELHRRTKDGELIGSEFTSTFVRSDLPDIVWTLRGVYAPDAGTYKDQKLATCFSRASGKADTPRDGDWESDRI